MISPLVLERSGKWRFAGLAVVFLIVILPSLPLVWRNLPAPGAFSGSFGGHFGRVLFGSLLVALAAAGASLVLGLPAGVLSALYVFPGRPFLLGLCALPLVTPTFLWAIGWSALAVHLGPRFTALLDGLPGCVFIFTLTGLPLVLFTAYAAAGSLSQSQVHAARLAGGEKTVLLNSCRHVAAPAALAAGLAGILSLSDPGPGQILGARTTATEILTSFAALYDFTLAAGECLLLAATILLLGVPLAWSRLPRLAEELLARQAANPRRLRHGRLAFSAAACLSVAALASTVAPLAGLCLTLPDAGDFLRVLPLVKRAALDTIIFGLGAGTLAVILALALAVCAGRNQRLRTLCLGILFVVFALPSAFSALGLVQSATAAPPWMDPFLRSRLTVCLALGLRFFPVAAVIGLRSWGTTSASWVLAASLHGVPLWKYLLRVGIPLFAPAGIFAGCLVCLLATADITTVLLLHPPGHSSLPLAIFTVMSNAPESLVAALCLFYTAAAGIVLTSFWTLAGKA